MKPKRISPQDARQRAKSGSALLICAYTDEGRCKSNNLEGAIKFGDLKKKLPAFSKNQEMIFYCACPQQSTSVGQAEKLADLGYQNVEVLEGGVEAWKQVGFVWHHDRVPQP